MKIVCRAIAFLMVSSCHFANAERSNLGPLDQFLNTVEQEAFDYPTLRQKIYRDLGLTDRYLNEWFPADQELFVYGSKQNTIPATIANPRAIVSNGTTVVSYSAFSQSTIELFQFDLHRGFNWGSILEKENRMRSALRQSECLKCHGIQVPIQNAQGVVKTVTIFRPLMGSGGRWPGWYGSELLVEELLSASKEAANFAEIKAQIQRISSKEISHNSHQWYTNLRFNSHLSRNQALIWFQILVSHPGFKSFRAALSALLLSPESSDLIDYVMPHLPSNLTAAQWQSRFDRKREEIVRKLGQFTEKLNQEIAAAHFPDNLSQYNERLRSFDRQSRANKINQMAMLEVIAKEMGMTIEHLSSDLKPIPELNAGVQNDFLFALAKVFPESKAFFPASYYPDSVSFAPRDMKRKYVDKFIRATLVQYLPITVDSLWHADSCSSAVATTQSGEQKTP